MAHTYRYPRPSLTVDCVVFGYDSANGLEVLLIERKAEPFRGRLALPGGFVNVTDDGSQGESLEDAARRELVEETGVKLTYIEQLYTFGEPGRDPRGRVVSVAYFALVRATDHSAKAGSDAARAEWVPVEEAQSQLLAFDHTIVLRVALQRLQAKVRYAPIGFNLMPEHFTLAELRELYEALLCRKLDVSNFRKRALSTGVLVATNRERTGSHRPAQLYRFDRRAYEKAMREGFNFEI